MMDTARQKEQEMLDRIADAEMARRLREEEEAKREEEEMAAQERFEVGFGGIQGRWRLHHISTLKRNKSSSCLI